MVFLLLKMTRNHNKIDDFLQGTQNTNIDKPLFFLKNFKQKKYPA